MKGATRRPLWGRGNTTLAVSTVNEAVGRVEGVVPSLRTERRVSVVLLTRVCVLLISGLLLTSERHTEDCDTVLRLGLALLQTN